MNIIALRRRRGNGTIFEIFKHRLLSFPIVDDMIVVTCAHDQRGFDRDGASQLLTLLRVMEAFTWRRVRCTTIEGATYFSFGRLRILADGVRQEVWSVRADVVVCRSGLIRVSKNLWWAVGPALSLSASGFGSDRSSGGVRKDVAHGRYAPYRLPGWGYDVITVNSPEDEAIVMSLKALGERPKRHELVMAIPLCHNACYQFLHAFAGKFWIVDFFTEMPPNFRMYKSRFWVQANGWITRPMRVRASEVCKVGAVELEQTWIFSTIRGELLAALERPAFFADEYSERYIRTARVLPMQDMMGLTPSYYDMQLVSRALRDYGGVFLLDLLGEWELYAERLQAHYGDDSRELVLRLSERI